MKAKTIKKVLSKKHSDFVESIQDEYVRDLVKKNSIITGGSIVSMLLNEPVNDYDYYFTDKETTKAVAEYFVNKFNQTSKYSATVKDEEGRISIFLRSKGIAGDVEINEDGNIVEEKENEEYKVNFLSSNAITLTDKVQLVVRFYGDAENIHKNYDFIHATCWWRSKDSHLELPQQALESIITRELVYQGSKYPLASIFRAKKFILRGWNINAGQYLKMALQLNDMDLTNVKTLEEQLTGVDAAYFIEIIHLIKERQGKDENFKTDTAYLIEVVNRVFN